MDAGEVLFRCRECGQVSAPAGDHWSCGGHAAFERTLGIWRVDHFAPSGFDENSRERLAGIEEDHFWFEARETLLLKRVAHLDPAPRRVLDLGCGNGRFLTAMAIRGAETAGIDAYPGGLERALQRTPAALLMTGDITRTPLPDASFDLISLLDVLEHVPPGPLLGEVRRLLAPGGRLLVAVPAFQSLWSQVDVDAGHRKRYRRGDLRQELADHGFTVETATYYQWLLFPLVWLSRRLDAKRDASLERNPPGLVGRLLGLINRAEVALFGGASLPWGSSLIVVARATGV